MVQTIYFWLLKLKDSQVQAMTGLNDEQVNSLKTGLWTDGLRELEKWSEHIQYKLLKQYCQYYQNKMKIDG